MVVLIVSTVEQVRPVVRPLLATWIVLRLAAVSTSPVPATGAAEPIFALLVGLPPPAPPSAMILPEASTLVEVVAARAASTLVVGGFGTDGGYNSGTQYCNLPTWGMPVTPAASGG